jgi:hypothetical protein
MTWIKMNSWIEKIDFMKNEKEAMNSQSEFTLINLITERCQIYLVKICEFTRINLITERCQIYLVKICEFTLINLITECYQIYLVKIKD